MSTSDDSITDHGRTGQAPTSDVSTSHHGQSQLEVSAQQREVARMRQLVKEQFWKAITDKWPMVRQDCGVVWEDQNSQLAKDCQMERRIIREHVEVFEHGALMSMVVFAALRLTGHAKFLPFVEQYVKPWFRLRPANTTNQGTTTTTTQAPANLAIKSTNTHTHTHHTALQATKRTNSKRKARLAQRPSSNNNERPRSFLELQRDEHLQRITEATDAPYDLFVSTLVGISTTMFFFRPSQLRLDFEEAPLMPGRSYWCNHMCDDFITIYQSTDPKIFQQLAPCDDVDLESYHKFALHCILRSAYIQKRKEAGELQPDVLPTNGPWDGQ